MTFEIVHALIYCGAGLLLLTGVGNYICRLLLIWSGLFKARTDAAQPVKTEPDQNLNGQIPPSATPPVERTSAPPIELPRVGRLVGVFERLILSAAILVSAWPIMAAVVALKSVARFKELDKKLDAEYFLVGSLFSVSWAMVVTWIWISYDKAYGLNLSNAIASSLAIK